MPCSRPPIGASHNARSVMARTAGCQATMRRRLQAGHTPTPALAFASSLTMSVSPADRSRWQPLQRCATSCAAATIWCLRAWSYRGEQRRVDGGTERREAGGDVGEIGVDLHRRCRRGGLGRGDGVAQRRLLARDRVQVVVDLRLLLERFQLGVVELTASLVEQRDLVHQRLGFTGRDDRLHLLLETGALGVDVVRVRFGALDRSFEVVDPLAQRVVATLPLAQRRLRGSHLLGLGQVGTAVAELVGERVGRLELEQRMRHERTRVTTERSAGTHEPIERHRWDGRCRVEHIGWDRSAAVDRSVDRSRRAVVVVVVAVVSSTATVVSVVGSGGAAGLRNPSGAPPVPTTAVAAIAAITAVRFRVGCRLGRLEAHHLEHALVARQHEPGRRARLRARWRPSRGRARAVRGRPPP